MSAEDWEPITRRADREIVGYLEPFDPGYSRVQPRSALGHPVGDPCDFVTGEDRLRERGIHELAEHWRLMSPQLTNALAILEVSPDGIVVADAMNTKAMIPTEQFRVAWPDLDQRLVRWNDQTHSAPSTTH